MLNQETLSWRQRRQEKEGEERLEQAKARVEKGPKDQARPPGSGAAHLLRAIPSPDLPGDQGGARSWGVPQRGTVVLSSEQKWT